MSEDYFAITDAVVLADAGHLVLPRAQAIARAILKHGDFDLIDCLARRGSSGEVTVEFLVVDVRCESVPPNNPHGIGYPERLALGVSHDQRALVEVQALRKSFPRLMHQNVAPSGTPASLCLYYEPARAVARTWTPESFLGRIQLWLHKAARDELHAADQAPEQLFFVTPYELVLPADFDRLRADDNVRFHLESAAERPAPGKTYVLKPVKKDNSIQGAIAPLILSLPPLVHGRVEMDPENLGGLADLLKERGADLKKLIFGAIQEQVDAAGKAKGSGPDFTVLLVDIPVTLTEGGAVERRARRAFFVLKSLFEVGTACGALLLQNGIYYREQTSGLLAPQVESTEWRSIEVVPMEVLFIPDSASARRQSGLQSEGPTGAFVGVGALGSSMLDILARCGWGSWTGIDNDHIRPHNLVRHVCRANHIGASKAASIVSLHRSIPWGGATKGLHSDACDFSDEALIDALKSGTVVVDASTTLEYPRLASTRNDLPRHASVFVTPDGNGAVLLLEDADRSLRLRTLEAQYYRAILTHDWGRDHLAYHLGRYYSGASCRDISQVMPYSRILGHASLLAEQLQQALVHREARIRVWSRDASTGVVQSFEAQPGAERQLSVGTYSVSIDSGLETKVRSMRVEGLPNETGGVLLGYFDLNVQSIVIVDALPAPPDSRATPGSFERGVEGLLDRVAEVGRRTAEIVRYVGEWHSHPPGHSSRASTDDVVQLAYLSDGLAHEGLPALQLIVGEKDLHIYIMGTNV